MAIDFKKFVDLLHTAPFTRATQYLWCSKVSTGAFRLVQQMNYSEVISGGMSSPTSVASPCCKRCPFGMNLRENENGLQGFRVGRTGWEQFAAGLWLSPETVVSCNGQKRTHQAFTRVGCQLQRPDSTSVPPQKLPPEHANTAPQQQRHGSTSCALCKYIFGLQEARAIVHSCLARCVVCQAAKEVDVVGKGHGCKLRRYTCTAKTTLRSQALKGGDFRM